MSAFLYCGDGVLYLAHGDVAPTLDIDNNAHRPVDVGLLEEGADDSLLRGIHGAFGLGLAYGILSGSCTFGFIAPILAIVTVQQKIVTGSVMMILFALGHCFPIAAAGSSTALVRRLTENSAWQGAEMWFRRGAGVVIALLGVYFILGPLVNWT